MTDRPIIFSGPMVLALLAGRKTQTRRLASSPLARCAPGDRLWVRESCHAEELARPPGKRLATAREQRASERTHTVVLDELDGADGVRFEADAAWLRIANTFEAAEAWSTAFHYGCRDGARPSGMSGKLIPSIHMPRWASRLTLIVTEVRVKPLQEITPADAWAEGVCAAVEASEISRGKPGWSDLGATDRHGIVRSVFGDGPTAYHWLWDQLHTKPGERWKDNPAVVALTFRVLRGNIDNLQQEQPHAG